MSSSSMPATTSATTGSVLPPPPQMQASSQAQAPPRRVETHISRDTVPAKNVHRSGVPGRTPIMASNDEILTLFSSIQDQMKQQQETNQMRMREIQLLKSNSKRHTEDTDTGITSALSKELQKLKDMISSGLGDKARWPRKNQQKADWKDKSKKKNKGQDTKKDHERAASPPPDAKIINFISRGSNICGTSYSASKRHAKEAKAERGDEPTRMTTLTTDKVITFDSDDWDNIQDPHHDGLVINLYIANHFVRRILVDSGSSVNIIQLETLKRMNIPQMEITSKSTVLVGFSGEAKNTVGEIKLPVCVEAVN
ncbi:uncharacterized protein LOC110944546 [Helianthus annuus]|uniref:uncharacterized protein LOC110944546 n=1 Tax=Helianthus annuus TaxID=4232 RepID=UPI000B8FE6A7|nr:uncharacterized protein LOC110944546 [Helianthus annuus]